LRKKRKFRGYVKPTNPHNINQDIHTDPIRLVGGNVQNDIVSLSEALKIAEHQGLDLVEISPKAKPPVCKVIDYKKFLYEQKKKAKEIKQNQVKTSIKEIRFGPNTDDHDFNFKKNHAINFLKEGNKVRAYVFFRGRAIMHKDLGALLLDRFAEELSDISKIESPKKMEGKKMIIVLSPTVKAIVKKDERTIAREEREREEKLKKETNA
jgi:translation initiation factor IF-3|tara:strand:- start:3393 stop:4019 length:627 start_codon:yes stop_codon:yes gene_type:complete